MSEYCYWECQLGKSQYARLASRTFKVGVMLPCSGVYGGLGEATINGTENGVTRTAVESCRGVKLNH